MKEAVRFPIVVGTDAQQALTKYLEGRQVAISKVQTKSLWWEEMRSYACEFLHALMRDNPGLRNLENFQQTLAEAEKLEGWQAV